MNSHEHTSHGRRLLIRVNSRPQTFGTMFAEAHTFEVVGADYIEIPELEVEASSEEAALRRAVSAADRFFCNSTV